MTPAEQLRILAAGEHGYVAARMVTYREDGTPPPEAIRRLGALADAVLSFLPGLGAELDPEAMARAQRAEESLVFARETLYEIGVVLEAANAQLDGTEPAAERLALEGIPSAHERLARPSETPPGFPAARAAMAGRWPEAGLYHGLLLVNTDGERRLFGEPIQGQWCVQTVAPDGLTAGERWSTLPNAWDTDTWSQCDDIIAVKPSVPRYDDAAKTAAASKAKATKAHASERTMSLFEEPAPPAPSAKTIGDYVPDDAQFVRWTEAMRKAIEAVGKPALDTLKEELRAVFVDWKTAHAAEEKPSPAAAFWHHAKATIVG